MRRFSFLRAGLLAAAVLMGGVSRAQFTSQYSTIYLPGNFNGYDTANTAMSLASNGLWQGYVIVTNYNNPQFLFSNYQFDNPPASNAFVWKETDQSQFGIPMSGTAELNSGSDISITGTVSALLKFTFNDQTRGYTVKNVSYSSETNLWINEFHYDDPNALELEFVELAGPTGSLTGYQLWLYNGSDGKAYRTNVLSGSITNEQNGMGTTVIGYTNLLQNGSPDGFALVRNGVVVQFLSYEGTFTALDGPASGMVSTAISPSEVNTTPTNFSIQLTGAGNSYSNFTWTGPALASKGAINAGQLILGGAPLGVVTVTNLAVSPALPLTGQTVSVTANINASGASNLSATLFYRVGTSGRFLPIAMTNSGNAFTTSTSIPAQAAGASVYYYVFVNFDGGGTNSPTQYPAGGPVAPQRYGVGTVASGAVWINELNPTADYLSNDDYEFIELAGIAGSAIGTWTVEVYSVTSTPVVTFSIPNTRVLPNDYNGFGFHVLGDTIGGLLNVDQAFPTIPDNVLNDQGAVRLLDQFGNVRDYVYWRWPGNPDPLPYTGTPRYIGYEVDDISGSDWVFALSGTGGTYGAFTWRTNVNDFTSIPTNTTPGVINTNQYLVGGNTNPIPPFIACPADVVYGCVTTPPAPNIALVSATGYCGSGSVTVTWVGGDTTNSGTGCKGNPRIVERKYRAVSTCGSTSTCSQFFIMEDTNAPTLLGPTQTLVNAGFEFGSTVGWTEFGTTNNNLFVDVAAPRSGFFHATLRAPYDLLAFDAASNEFDGVYMNGVTRGVAPATTAQVFSAQFDGVDDYVEVPTPLNLHTNAITITTWLRRNGSQPSYAGIAFSRGTNTVSGLDFTTTNQLGYHWRGAANTYGWMSGIIPPDTQWCFVALTISSSRAELYMRTTSSWSFAANVVSHGLEEFDAPLNIARDPSGGRQFKGWLDDMQVYNRRLSSNEIVGIWNNGVGGITQTNVYARWMFNESYAGTSTRGLYQDLVASSGQYWNASTFALMSAADPLKGTNEVTLALQFLNVSNTVLLSTNSAVRITSASPTSQYVRMLSRGTAPAGTTKARLRIQYQQDGAGSQGSVHLDDAFLSDTVVVAASNTCGVLPNYMTSGLIVATDNCGSVTLTQTPAPNSTLTNAIIPVTITARDGCNNLSQLSFSVSVDDTNPPTDFAISPSATTNSCFAGLPTNTSFSVSDNCSAGWFVTLLATGTNGGTGCSSSPIVASNIWMLTDLGGNTIIKTQLVTAIDVAVPTAVCVPPALSNGTFESGVFTTNWNTFGPNVQVLNTSPRSGTYHAKLAGETNGATSYSGFYQDLPTEPGVTWRLGAWVATPTNEIISPDNYLEAKIEFLNDAQTIINSYSTKLFTNGLITHGLYQQLHVTAIPLAGSVKARATIVYVQSNNAPGAVFVDDVTLSRNAYSATNMAYTGAYLQAGSVLTGVLACAGSLADVTNIPTVVDCHLTTVSQFPAISMAMALGTNLIRLPVQDECGNTSTCMMNAVVFDVTQPIILSGPSNVTVATTNLIPAPNIALVTATDICSAVVITNLPDQRNGGAGTVSDPLIVLRRYLARDVSGNVTNFDQIITVNGGTPVAPTNVAVQGFTLGTNFTIRSTGTNTWGVLAEYTTNLLGAQGWLQISNANNIFSNGTNITTFVLPTNALPAYIRVKQTYP